MGILNRKKIKNLAVVLIVLVSLAAGLGGVAYATGTLKWGGEDDDLRVRVAIDSMITKANAELKKATDALNITKLDLEKTTSDLQNATKDLETKNTTLNETQDKLEKALEDLATAEGKLATTEGKLATAEGKLATAETELDDANDKLAKARLDMKALADYAEGRVGDINTFDPEDSDGDDDDPIYPELTEGMKVNKGEIVSYKGKNYEYLKDNEFEFRPANLNEHPDYPGSDMWKLIE